MSGNVGLFNAIASHPRGQDALFFGTPGCETDEWTERTKREVAKRYAAEERSRAIFVTDETFDGSYRGYAKTVLWPLLHYTLDSLLEAMCAGRLDPG